MPVLPPSFPPWATSSVEQTRALGRALGQVVPAGATFALLGDLGAGKTAFVQGVAEGLDVPAGTRVVSPTFTLVCEYRGGRLPLWHADLYRLDHAAELEALGLDDAMGGPGVVAVEWADKFDAMPRDHFAVRIDICGETERHVEVGARGRRSEAAVAAWWARASKDGVASAASPR